MEPTTMVPLPIFIIDCQTITAVNLNIPGVKDRGLFIVFNFLGLGSRLPDQQSKEITFQAAFEQGIAIVETMKLHIFREENILFPQAMHLFSENDFDKLIL